MAKNVFYLILLVIVMTACSKKADDPAPDAATRVSGTYDVSRLLVSGTGTNDIDVTLPRTGTLGGATVTQSGVITVAKVTETTVSVKLALKTSGQSDSNSDFGTLEIRGTDLYESNAKVGTADGSTFNLDATDSGVRILVNSKKK